MNSEENVQINRYKQEKTNGKFPFFVRGKMDIVFMSLVFSLLVFGLVMVFSASYAYSYYYNDGDSYYYILHQSLYALGGVVAMFLLSRIDYRNWQFRKMPWFLYFFSVFWLVLVLILPPVGDKDVKRWISVFGIFTFQPSEIAKFAIIVLFAYLISKYSKQMTRWGILFFPFLTLFAIVGALLFLEPHLSATIIVFLISVVLIFAGGAKIKHLLIGGGFVGVGAVVLAVCGGISYVKDRFSYWFDPWSDPTGKGYQTIQSLYAIGSGGIFGRGIGQSRQKYLWLPEPQNDFIFSIVCEETGLIGALFVVALFVLLVVRGIRIAKNAPDKFASLLVLGLVFQVGLQAALNILVVTNIIMNTGISLPFFSYGGTSLMMLLGEMGIVLSVSRSSSVKKR